MLYKRILKKFEDIIVQIHLIIEFKNSSYIYDLKMEQQETNIQFNEFINSIYRKIKSENISELKVEMSSIDKYEEFFLKNYNKRKKEGVYYTVDTVSNFISNEVLLILINNYLSQASTNISEFREIEQIFKSNTNTQERISKFLINATICDPTCGSGVFLLSSVKMIFNIISRINPEIQVHDIKKKLLKNLKLKTIVLNILTYNISEFILFYSFL